MGTEDMIDKFVADNDAARIKALREFGERKGDEKIIKLAEKGLALLKLINEKAEVASTTPSHITEQVVGLGGSNDEVDRRTGQVDAEIGSVKTKSAEMIEEVGVDSTEDVEDSGEALQQKIMMENNFGSTRELNGGTHGGAKIVEIDGDGSAILKGYEQFTGQERKNFIGSERAAFLISQGLGFDFIPPTVIRKVKGENGELEDVSLQSFIPDTKSLGELSPEEVAELPQDEKYRMAVFDIILNNTDRSAGNVLIKNGKLIAIDHGISMTPESISEKLPTDNFNPATSKWISDLFYNPIPETVIASVKKFVDDADGQNKLKQQITEVLGEHVAMGYLNRFKAFLESIRDDSSLDPRAFEKNLNKYYGQLN